MSLSSDGAPMLTMPVAPTNTGGNGGFGWGDNGALWLIVLFLFIFAGGWGNGFGNNGNGGGGVIDGYVLTSDFANVERKIDSVNQGLCDGFYQQAQLVNGTNMAMANGFARGAAPPQWQSAGLGSVSGPPPPCAPCAASSRLGLALAAPPLSVGAWLRGGSERGKRGIPPPAGGGGVRFS